MYMHPAGAPRGKSGSASSHSSSDARPATCTTTALAVDDKVLRRREQYKVHQRRHRAKQKEMTMRLEREVSALHMQVARLQEHRTLLESRLFSSRGCADGLPTQIAIEYFRAFEFAGPHQQVRFLRSTVDEDVQGPDYRGVEFLAAQWHIYGRVFRTMRWEQERIEVTTVGDMTSVEVDLQFVSCPHRDTVLTIYPSIAGDEELIHQVLTTPLRVPGKYRMIFNAQGIMTWIGAEMDFVGGLQATFGSLRKVSVLMRDSKMSFCTGQILPENVAELPPTDASDADASSRCTVSYVLSA